MTHPARSRRRPFHTEARLLAAAALLAAALVTAGATLLWPQSAAAPSAADPESLPDMNGRSVTFDSGTVPVPGARARMNAQSQVDKSRLHIPEVGLDVPLGAMNVVDGAVQPPTFTSAYRIRDLGTTLSAPNRGTVFVVMHSLRDGGVGPGNFLFDTATSQPKVRAGQVVDASGVRYVITGTGTVRKTAISSDTGVWADTPGRLVIITCLQRPQGGPSLYNFIVTAQVTAQATTERGEEASG